MDLSILRNYQQTANKIMINQCENKFHSHQFIHLITDLIGHLVKGLEETKPFRSLLDSTKNSLFLLNLIRLTGFFYFKLFICHPNVKRFKFLKGFISYTPTKALL